MVLRLCAATEEVAGILPACLLVVYDSVRTEREKTVALCGIAITQWHAVSNPPSSPMKASDGQGTTSNWLYEKDMRIQVEQARNGPTESRLERSPANRTGAHPSFRISIPTSPKAIGPETPTSPLVRAALGPRKMDRLDFWRDGLVAYLSRSLSALLLNYLNVLTLCVPMAVVLQRDRGAPACVFVLSLLAIVPLAERRVASE